MSKKLKLYYNPMVQWFSNYLTYTLLNLQAKTHLADTVNFFIYDSIKIFSLLFIITLLMGVVRIYLPIQKMRDLLVSKRWFGADYLLAALFGAITPFCSCSSIPLFIGFLGARIPLGITFAFLITSPLVNEVALALFIGLFGWKVTVVYALSGILLGMVGGYVLGKLKLERYVEEYIWQTKINESAVTTGQAKNILRQVVREALGIIKKVALYILIGVALGALIHGYVPTGYFEQYLSANNLFAVPIAVVLAVPLYSNATGVIPIIQALVAKGIPLGTALAFMMATVGLSLPEALILKKVMKWQLLAAFFGVVTVSIIGLGYLFNIILPRLI